MFHVEHQGCFTVKWFKHDTGASHTRKIVKLRNKHGYAGTGLYWTCLEEIGKGIDASNLSFELEQDAEVLAIWGGLDVDVVEVMMKYMIEIGLFETDETEKRIFCFAFAARIENSIVKNPYFKKLQKLLKSKNPDLSRIAREESGKLGLEVDTDIDIESSTTTMNDPKFVDKSGSTRMTLAWSPSNECSQALLYEAYVSGEYIDEYLVQFKLYWMETGKENNTWNALFYQQCSEQWNKAPATR